MVSKIEYNKAVKQGQRYVQLIEENEESIFEYRVKICALAIKVCDSKTSPEFRLQKAANCSKTPMYSYKDFFRDIKANHFSMMNFMKTYKNVILKSNMLKNKKVSQFTKKQIQAINRVGINSRRTDSSSKIDKALKNELERKNTCVKSDSYLNYLKIILNAVRKKSWKDIPTTRRKEIEDYVIQILTELA